MKQRIDISDLQQLTPEQQERLREWWQPSFGDMFVYKGIENVIDEDYWCVDEIRQENKSGITGTISFLPLLSIGQMIEALRSVSSIFDIDYRIDCKWEVHFKYKGWYEAKELCDALWDAVKGVL